MIGTKQYSSKEIALYKRISSQEVSFSFITYGNKEDLKFQDQLGI